MCLVSLFGLLPSNRGSTPQGRVGHLTWTLLNPQCFATIAMHVWIPPMVSAFISTLLSLLSLTLLLLVCVIRKKRRMEGTYKPSAEERKQTRVAGSEKPSLPLPLPKEERLI
ncbi:crumbs-like 3-like [Solea senegalensis]|uniref:Crumbs-like 3-like n=1 Tax=Solea senegalensis TaxID=28829 RepID=A0AAV6PER6_SOLSE|nr:protein crumbs homolog 3b isoform X1 [Solea senegalensis]KAG7457232.1 crumbs-like 3-like [Solea senegalensis]